MRPVTVTAALLLWGISLLPGVATAARFVPPPSFQIVAQEAAVPDVLLYALTQTESNAGLVDGSFSPWPWTLNVAGKSFRYHTRSEACRALHEALTSYRPGNVDVGIAQVNIGANGHRFASPCAGLDPMLNLRTAAQILREQFEASKGSQSNAVEDWIWAAGRYHRPAGGEPAAKYRTTVRRFLRKLGVSV